MTKIKIFNGAPDILDRDVDKWIKEKTPNIIQISTSGERYNYVLAILYNDQQSISLNS